MSVAVGFYHGHYGGFRAAEIPDGFKVFAELFEVYIDAGIACNHRDFSISAHRPAETRARPVSMQSSWGA